MPGFFRFITALICAGVALVPLKVRAEDAQQPRQSSVQAPAKVPETVQQAVKIPEAVNGPETLTWAECVREAAKNHPDLIAAQQVVMENEAGKRISASGEYPQINGSASASTSKTSGEQSTDSYSAGVTGSQLIFDGKKTINNVKASQENINASKQSFQFTSADVRQRLRTAYVNLLKAQEQITISRQIYDIRRGNLELITLRYQSGLEHKGALMTAQANLSEAQYGITQAERDLEVAQKDLAKEMGREKWTALCVQGEFVVRDDGKGEIDLTAIAQKNPQVLRAAAQKNAANFNLRSTYGNYAPKVTVSGSAQETGADMPPDKGGVSAGVAVTMPIFEGGLRKAQVDQAKATLDQLEAAQRSTRDTVLLTLQQTRAALQDAVDNVDVQNKFLQATEERSKIAQAQYSIGTITFDSWTIIEDNLVTAKRTYLTAQANALLAEANWVQAKGETLEYENQ
ncbi:MAG: TolC family protein [Deltaproteobacteria bacterium]